MCWPSSPVVHKEAKAQPTSCFSRFFFPSLYRTQFSKPGWGGALSYPHSPTLPDLNNFRFRSKPRTDLLTYTPLVDQQNSAMGSDTLQGQQLACHSWLVITQAFNYQGSRRRPRGVMLFVCVPGLSAAPIIKHRRLRLIGRPD